MASHDADDDDMAPLRLEWRGPTARRQLPGYGDWLRGSPEPLWCDVITLAPRLRLPWAYTPEQEEEGDVWECGAVWLHSAAAPNGAVYTADLHEDLRQALEGLRSNVKAAKHTLLVNPAGLPYDQKRLGGDHQVVASGSRRRFTLSVRATAGREPLQRKLLLAIAWT
jgi:hypothetical protein